MHTAPPANPDACSNHEREAPPPAAFVALVACGLTWFVLREFKWAARVGIFGFPVFQVFFDPAGQVLATAALMSIIGLRYLVARRRGRYATARSAPVGSP